MAAKLTESNNKVVALRPGKARGAGGAKRSGKPVNRLKPAAHEAKPKRSVAKTQPSDADIRRNMQDRLLALHTQHRTVDNRLDVAKAAIADIALEKKEIRAAIQNAGFPLALYDEGYNELKLKTKTVDLVQKEAIRGLIREALGLPAGPQPSLLDALPEAAKPAAYWNEVGYREALVTFADPAAAGCPPENNQDYMAGYHECQEKIGQGIKTLAKEAPKPSAAPLIPAENEAAGDGGSGGAAPTWEGFDNDPDQWTVEQQEAFKAWFDGLAPDAEVDITHPGVEAAFDKAVHDVEFEASQAELGAQIGRQAVVGDRDEPGSEMLN